MTEHTPGPWEALAGDWDEGLDGYCRYTISPLRKLSMADANLIAAAPELYKALKNMRELSKRDDIKWGPANADADNAIAKAEGRS